MVQSFKSTADAYRYSMPNGSVHAFLTIEAHNEFIHLISQKCMISASMSYKKFAEKNTMVLS